MGRGEVVCQGEGVCEVKGVWALLVKYLIRQGALTITLFTRCCQVKPDRWQPRHAASVTPGEYVLLRDTVLVLLGDM